MYRFEKRNQNADYTKRQILLVQEDYKVFLPALFLLAALLIVLDALNIVHEYMAVYINVLINVVGVCFEVIIVSKLAGDNRRQRELFEFLDAWQELDAGRLRRGRYERDTEEMLKGATEVNVVEKDDAFVITAVLPAYRHRPVTRYDFRGDFGKLTLPKAEYTASEKEGRLTISGDGREFVFALTAEEVRPAKAGAEPAPGEEKKEQPVEKPAVETQAAKEQ